MWEKDALLTKAGFMQLKPTVTEGETNIYLHWLATAFQFHTKIWFNEIFFSSSSIKSVFWGTVNFNFRFEDIVKLNVGIFRLMDWFFNCLKVVLALFMNQ